MSETGQHLPSRLSDLWAWLVPALLLVAAIAVALYRGWPLLFPEVAVTAPLNPTCDLQRGPCRAVFAEGGEVRLDIAPRPIPILHPLRLRVETRDIAVDAVEVDFVGTDMDMGFNRVALRPGDGNTFIGDGMLPICAQTRMEWEARVMLHTPRGLWVAPFRFETMR